MTLINDRIIKQKGHEILDPFEPDQVNYWTDLDRKVISYGTSSFGYDIRLSPKEFLLFEQNLDQKKGVVNPKKFDPTLLRKLSLNHDEDGSFFILPAHSYGLGVSIEQINMPNYMSALCIGKSTYARAGIHLNTTPLEASWKGNLTLEISNASCYDCRVYANEGIGQLLFFSGSSCETSYADRKGKYQNQTEKVVFSKA